MKMLLLAVLGFCAASTFAEKPKPPASTDPRLGWWREARFGMFIHYGPVTLTGKEISWSRANSNPKCPNHGPTPVAVYDNLYREFNPTNFNAADWAGIAKEAGMKYVVLTAKHCDGFLLWNSRVSDYNIMHTPFHRDLCAELAGAVRRDGLHIGWYFSPMDWRDPDFRTARNDVFVKRMQDELRELLSHYGRIDLMWFDWDGREPVYDQAGTYALVKRLQPEIINDNRLDLGPGDNDRMMKSPFADYYTPEQQIGAYDDQRPWETCMTLGTQWSWKPLDKIKSAAEVVSILCRTVGGDGNFLLDIGPMPDGRIEPRQAEVLQEIGAWLKVNGESIYGTRGGPWKPNESVASTRRGNTIYVHLLSRPDGPLKLQPIPAKIIGARILGSHEHVYVRQTQEEIGISVPPSALRANGTVVALTLNSDSLAFPALDAAPVASTIPTHSPVSAPLPGYKLVWSDEFIGDNLDTNKWDFRTDSRMWSTQLPEDVSVRDGRLVLTVKKQDAGGKHYTGAGVISKRAFKYGYYEARFKVPPGEGWHTSFWMMKSNGQGGTGPNLSAQELDVCENDSLHQNRYAVNVHKWNPKPHLALGTKTIPTPNLSDSFHVFGCEFTPETVKYYFDGRLVQTVDVSHFAHSDQNIWLTTIASNLGGTKAVDDSRLPAAAEFDYVRYYEKDPP